MNANKNAHLRFARRMGEHFPCPEYANPIEPPEEGPGLLSSLAFWVLGTLSAVLFWTLIAWGLEAAF